MTEPSDPRAVADRIIDALLERYVAVIPMAERERLAGEIEAVRRAEAERCAKIADEAREMRERLFNQNGASINAAKAAQAEAIVAAIRGNRND